MIESPFQIVAPRELSNSLDAEIARAFAWLDRRHEAPVNRPQVVQPPSEEIRGTYEIRLGPHVEQGLVDPERRLRFMAGAGTAIDPIYGLPADWTSATFDLSAGQPTLSPQRIIAMHAREVAATHLHRALSRRYLSRLLEAAPSRNFIERLVTELGTSALSFPNPPESIAHAWRMFDSEDEEGVLQSIRSGLARIWIERARGNRSIPPMIDLRDTPVDKATLRAMLISSREVFAGNDSSLGVAITRDLDHRRLLRKNLRQSLYGVPYPVRDVIFVEYGDLDVAVKMQ